MCAIIFKICTFDTPQENHFLSVLCNMRRHVGLSENYIGNCISAYRVKMSSGDLREKSILEIAKIVRDQYSKLDRQHLSDYQCWLRYFKLFEEKQDDYLNILMGEESSIIVNNFSSFKYNDLRFGTSPLLLTIPPVERLGIYHIILDQTDSASADPQGPDEYFSTNVKISDRQVAYALEFASKSELFKVH